MLAAVPAGEDVLFNDLLRLIQENNACAKDKEALTLYVRGRKTAQRLRPGARHEAMMVQMQQHVQTPPHSAFHVGAQAYGATAQAYGSAYVPSAPPPMLTPPTPPPSAPSLTWPEVSDLAHMACMPAEQMWDEFVAAMRERRIACTNCGKMAPRDRDAHEVLDCNKDCRMCGYPPNSHLGAEGPLGYAGRCIRYDGWAKKTGRPALTPPGVVAPAQQQQRGGGKAGGKGKPSGFRKIGKPITKLAANVRHDAAMRVYDLDVELGRIATESIKYAASDSLNEDTWGDIEASYDATHAMREEIAAAVNAQGAQSNF